MLQLALPWLELQVVFHFRSFLAILGACLSWHPLPHYLFLSITGWTLCLQHLVLFDWISVVLKWKHRGTSMRHLLILYLSNIYILNVDRFNFFIESNCHYRTSNICTWQMFRFFMSESILLCSHLLLIIPNVWGLFCFHMKVFVCFFCTEAPLHTMGDSCLSLMLLIKMGIDFKENSATRQRREGLKRFSSKRKYSLKD